jgi:hypothetical protein
MNTEQQDVFEDEAATADTDEDAAEGGNSGRIRSTIAFPYTPLADAEQVAHALHDRGGTAAMDELAAQLNQVISSGAFRTKVATARTFGAASVRRGQATLTDLGRRLVDSSKVDQARVDAFLTVPLYRKVYDEYKGHTLPGPEGLENAMARFGVSPKQTEKARQAFQRSAEQAGFFRQGSDRLVSPALTEAPVEFERDIYFPDGELPPAVMALVIQLLEGGEDWTAEQTVAFVNAARTVYKLS